MICYLEIFYYVSSNWRSIENWKLVIFKVARYNITLWKDLRRKFLSLPSIYYFIRSQIFFKIVVLKNFAIFTGKHSYWSFFFIKLQVIRPAALLKRDSNTGVFLWILQNFSEQLLLQNISSCCFSQYWWYVFTGRNYFLLFSSV